MRDKRIKKRGYAADVIRIAFPLTKEMYVKISSNGYVVLRNLRKVDHTISRFVAIMPVGDDQKLEVIKKPSPLTVWWILAEGAKINIPPGAIVAESLSYKSTEFLTIHINPADREKFIPGSST